MYVCLYVGRIVCVHLYIFYISCIFICIYIHINTHTHIHICVVVFLRAEGITNIGLFSCMHSIYFISSIRIWHQDIYFLRKRFGNFLRLSYFKTKNMHQNTSDRFSAQAVLYPSSPSVLMSQAPVLQSYQGKRTLYQRIQYKMNS